MRFYCCGLLYSTDDPETYWCIEKYVMKRPSLKYFDGKKITKEIVYTLSCKKNDCCKVKILRYYEENGIDKPLKIKNLSKENAKKFLERTKTMRIRQPQCCTIKKVQNAKNIPWVYGKALDGETQVARYLDESGNRNVFKNQIWQSEIIKSTIKTYNI